MSSDQKVALAKLREKAEDARAVSRPEIMDNTTVAFSWRQIVALDDLIVELAGERCHDRNCPVHFKGIPPTGQGDSNG